MAVRLADITAAALELSDAERVDLAAILLASLRAQAPDLHLTSDEEVARRAADLDSGRTRTIPGEDVLKELRDIIGNHPDSRVAFDAILWPGRS